MSDRENYREMMARLRGPVRGDSLGELPEDPDIEHVPEALRALDGRPVMVAGIDCETGERVYEAGTFVAPPGMFGDLARREQEER